MEVLEHRNQATAGALGASDGLSVFSSTPRSSPQTEGMNGSKPPAEGMDHGHAGPLELFHPADPGDDPGSSMVLAEALRCQVKISTRRSLHLRIANHTTRDVYVRLVGHGGRIAGISAGPQRTSVDQTGVKDSAPLCPIEGCPFLSDSEHRPEEATDDLQSAGVTMETTNIQRQTPKTGAQEEEEEEEEGGGASLTISELNYSPCPSILPTPVEDSQGGVSSLSSSPVQSPALLLRELHADPDIQAQLEAERERDRAYERTRLAARSRVGGVLSLLSSNQRVNACLLSGARLLAVVVGVLLVTVPTLLLLLESDLDVSFLHEIRQTPEFEQFHYEYYCPLRRWVLCRVSAAMDDLWSD